MIDLGHGWGNLGWMKGVMNGNGLWPWEKEVPIIKALYDIVSKRRDPVY